MSQFILITHHKRTTSAAVMLTGMAMQEPRVSKLKSVRFKDWTDENKQLNFWNPECLCKE